MIAYALLCCMLLHPFHVSIGQAQWNQQTQRIEISLRLDPSDLTKALARQAKAPIDLETDDAAELKKQLLAYVRKGFVVTDAKDRAAVWHFVGMENEVKHVWLYLELQPHKDSQQLKLTNTMLNEVAPSQVSTIIWEHADDGKQRSTLRFSRAHPREYLIRAENDWIVKQDETAQ